MFDKTLLFMHDNDMTDSHGHGEQKPSILSDALAIVGFIILTIIVIWGLVHLVSLTSSWIGSLFPKHTTGIQVSAPTEAISGDPLTVSWKYTPTTTGSYAVLYQCRTGFQFVTYSANNSYNAIPCGSAFNTGSASTSIAVIPVLDGTTTTPVSLTVLYIPTGIGAQTTGTATINIHAGSLVMAPATTPAKTTTTTTKAKTTVVHRATGPADLSVHIVAVGVIDPGTGAFIARTPTSPSDMAAVEFDIANVGNSSTGTYYFQAQLPTQSGYNYQSPAQASLAPGDHVLNTLRFTQVAAGGGTFTVTVDPAGNVADYNANNNYASQFVPMPNYYTYPGYQY